MVICSGNADPMSRKPLSTEQLGFIADRFKALSEPSRLEILNTLREGERTVSEILEATGLGQANVSKHLQLLYASGFVDRTEGRRSAPTTGWRTETCSDSAKLMCGKTGGGAGEEETIRLRARISFPAVSSSQGSRSLLGKIFPLRDANPRNQSGAAIDRPITSGPLPP
jgi:DNA-binding transcriptional ArsR family regulator